MSGEGGQPDAAPGLPPGRYVWLPGRGRTFVRELAGPAGRAGARAAARLDGDRRPQLVRLLRPARRALPRRSPSTTAATAAACARPSRSASSSAPTTSPPSPASSGIDAIRPRRLLDGRPDRPARLAAPPRARRRARAVRDERHVHRHGPRAACSSASPPAPASSPAPCRSARLTSAALGPLERLAQPPRRGVVGVRRGRPPRLGRRSSRPAGRSVRFDSRRGSATSPCRPRSSSPTTTTWCPSHRQLALADRLPRTHRSGGSPAATPCARRRPSGSCRRCSPPARGRRPRSPTDAMALAADRTDRSGCPRRRSRSATAP